MRNFSILIIVLFVLIQVPSPSTANSFNKKDIMKNGKEVETTLINVNKRISTDGSNSFFTKPFLKHVATYEFSTTSRNRKNIYRVDFETRNKKQITKTKTIYCMEYKDNQCAWPDTNHYFNFIRILMYCLGIFVVVILATLFERKEGETVENL